MALAVRQRGDAHRRWAWSPGSRTAVIVALLLSLAAAALVVYVLHTQRFTAILDPHGYDYLARTLARGHGWGYGNSAYRPPGYPVFLAGVYLLVGIPHGHGVFTAARLAEAVLATFTVGMIGLLALQVAGRVAALIALAIAAVYMPLVLVGVSLLSESLFLPLMLAATNCALRARASRHPYRWIAAAGLFSGLAALTRGNGIVLGLALAVVVWTRRPRRSWRSALGPVVLLLVMSLTIAPWTIRNAYAQHAFIPVTDELGNTLKGTYNDLSLKQKFVWSGHGYSNYRSIQNDRHLSEAQRGSRLTSAVIDFIGHHPLYLPDGMFWNTVRLLDLQSRRASRSIAAVDADASAAFADIGVVNFWIVGALAILGGLTLLARRAPRSLWLVPLLMWASVAPVNGGTPRFRAALDPFVILLAAFAIEGGARALMARRKPEQTPGKSPRQRRPRRRAVDLCAGKLRT
ncbi:MAG: ArnT family glycosyltransferase [Solirubrobacteraceae bacterium]